MTPKIKSRFNASCIEEVQKRYGLDAQVKLLSDWHAFTFETYAKGKPYILRVSDDTHRTQADIEAELEWMTFVRNAGIKTPAIIPSIYTRCTEMIDSGESRFTAVLFEKLNGRVVSEADWNPPLFEKWGGLVGRLHYLSTQFKPVTHRFQWQQSDFLNIDTYIPDELSDIKRVAYELLSMLDSLPRLSTSFGLIHADVYQDNFFISEDGLQLFDFDNCEYGFFLSDIATSLYAALWRIKPEEDQQAFATIFLRYFLIGYCKEFQFDHANFDHLHLFLRLRDLLIYIVARKKLDLSNLTPIQARRLKERGERILNKTPVVHIDALFK
jgi:amicoumacin kinase